MNRSGVNANSPTLDEFTSSASVSWMPLSDYNRNSGANASLKSGEALMYTKESYRNSTMTVADQTYTIVKEVPSFSLCDQLTTSAYPCYHSCGPG